LTHAEGTIDTVYGTLSNTWAKIGEDLTMDITVPVNTIAQVLIPSADPKTVRESGRPLHGVDGALGITYDSKRSATVVTIGSGDYAFAVKSIPPRPNKPKS